MKRLISVLKSIRLRQVLTVFLVGVVLLVNTACSKTQAYDDTMKGLPGGVEPEMSKSARIKPEPKSGMNNYSDTDPRLKTTEAEKSAQNLVENADKNITEKRATNPDQLGQNYREGAPLGERTQRFAEDVGSSAEGVKGSTQNLLKGAQRNAQDTSDRVGARASGAVKDTQRSAQATSDRTQAKTTGAVRDTQRASEDALNRTGSAARNTGDRVQAKTQSAAEDTQQASGNIFNKVTKSVKRATEDASDFVGDKTDRATKGTQRALEDTSDALSGNRA